MRILCIDDSKAVHSYIEAVLEGFGYEFSHCFNGKEGADTFALSPDSYDLILLDWEMPIMMGIDALLEIRKVSKDIPLIMVTTKNDFQDIALALERGASDYVMKPFTKDILVEKISSLVVKRAS